MHQKAGSKEVYEIHGTTQKCYCHKCNKEYDYDYIFNCDNAIPKCECGGRIRPDVTLYGEKLPKKAWDMAIKTISKADMLIVAGTSLTVYPAASLVSEFRGKYIAVINKGGVDKNKVFADIVIDDDMTKVFEKITC